MVTLVHGEQEAGRSLELVRRVRSLMAAAPERVLVTDLWDGWWETGSEVQLFRSWEQVCDVSLTRLCGDRALGPVVLVERCENLVGERFAGALQVHRAFQSEVFLGARSVGVLEGPALLCVQEFVSVEWLGPERRSRPLSWKRFGRTGYRWVLRHGPWAEEADCGEVQVP